MLEGNNIIKLQDDMWSCLGGAITRITQVVSLSSAVCPACTGYGEYGCIIGYGISSSRYAGSCGGDIIYGTRPIKIIP